jgi:hypothetical protein
MNNKLFSLENIQFQNTSFLEDLSMLVKYIRVIDKSTPDAKFFQSKEFIDLEKCIFRYTGIKTVFEGCKYGLAVYVPNVNKNSIFNNEFKKYIYSNDDTLEGSLNKLTQSQELKGYIDLKTAKVSGLFSTIVNRILINRNLLADVTFANEEVAACILHEIGHVFTWLEYSSRVCSTNQVLSLLNKANANELHNDEIEYVYKKVKDADLLTDEELSNIRNDDNPKSVQIIVMGATVRKSVSELGYSVYDSTSSEQLADQFATRFGAGRHVVNALYKLNGLNSITPIPLILTTIASFFLVGGIVTGVMITAFIISETLFNGDAKVYDSAKDRVLRIMNQNTERLKNRLIGDTEKEYYLEQNKSINKLVSTLSEDVEIIKIVVRLFSRSRGKMYESEVLQKDLEVLAFNQLFDKSAELSLLTKG